MKPDDTFETAAGPRRRRVLRGDGLVTPREAITFDGDRLIPGRSRLVPDHPAVRANPELFDPFWSEDREVLRALDRLLTHRIREARAAEAGAGWRLAATDVRRRSWEL